MEHALSLFVRSIFADNMIFAYFLGMCSLLIPRRFEEREDLSRSGRSRYFRARRYPAG